MIKIPKLEAYKIILTNYNEDVITTSLPANKQYEPGEVTFTVTCDMACVVAVENEDGSFTKVPCTTTDSDEHEFTVTITDANVKVSVAIRGDTNLDGEIDVVDLSFDKQVMSGKRTLTGFAALVADTDGDGEIDVTDLSFVKQVMTGKKTLDW